MRSIPRLDDEVEFGALGRQIGEYPLVINLDDVGACVTQHAWTRATARRAGPEYLS